MLIKEILPLMNNDSQSRVTSSLVSHQDFLDGLKPIS